MMNSFKSNTISVLVHLIFVKDNRSFSISATTLITKSVTSSIKEDGSMLHAFRLVRTQPHPLVPSTQLPSSLGRKTSIVRFPQARAESRKPEKRENMDKTQHQKDKSGALMSDSFGEGYSTRSDEEGFGGIYGGNQALPKSVVDKACNPESSDFDKTQGSEVKEKEKGRHQTNVE
ncbi:PREDICTED: uncharacterized protein LOC104595702 isoform X2 [Nelumbo nucifera]|uniref:Uncharacterized protein LOC104595702 isoform X2 n=1 Tax=Nelumbo nucifera TaxID=4432 RepID=A0A1U7ZNG2_NELNU|nr:PREDICTED: uncharacterized protein LOC104595702 isoform X2 [Nelumbo nucifera]